MGQRPAVVAGGRRDEPRRLAAPARSRTRSAALNAPRILYELVGWTISSLRWTSAPRCVRQPVRAAQRRPQHAAAGCARPPRGCRRARSGHCVPASRRRPGGCRRAVPRTRIAAAPRRRRPCAPRRSDRCARARRTRSSKRGDAASAFSAAIVAIGVHLLAVQIEDHQRRLERLRLRDHLVGRRREVISMPRCFAVVRTFERKKRSSTDEATRIMLTDRDHTVATASQSGSFSRWSRRFAAALFVVERHAVPTRRQRTRPGTRRSPPRRRRRTAASRWPRMRDDVAAHQLQRADRQQDPQLGRTDLQERELERPARVRGERDLDDQQVIGGQERRGRASGSCGRRASVRRRGRRSPRRPGRGRRSSHSAAARWWRTRASVPSRLSPNQFSASSGMTSSSALPPPRSKPDAGHRDRPSAVRWSELTHAGSPPAIRTSRRFSDSASTLVCSRTIRNSTVLAPMPIKAQAPRETGSALGYAVG